MGFVKLFFLGSMLAIAYANSMEERLSNAMQFHIFQGNFLEAWRIGQVAIRTNHRFSNLDALTSLSLLKQRSCPLNPTSLEKAHIFRFLEQFSKSPKLPEDLFSNSGIYSILDQQRHFYLADIPYARPIPGRPCKAYSLITDVVSKEAKNLREFLHSEAIPLEPLERAHILARIAWLNDPADLGESALSQLLADNGKFLLLLVPQKESDPGEDELKALWPRIKTKSGNTFPLPSTHPWYLPITKMVMVSNKEFSSHWLSQIDIWDPQKLPLLKQLLEHLLSLPKVSHRPQLLGLQTWTHYIDGDLKSFLQTARTLFTTENEVPPEIQNVLTQAVQDLLMEHTYDDTLLGALASSLPKNIVGQSLIHLLIQEALNQHNPGYGALKELVLKHRLLQETYVEILTSLAENSSHKTAELVQNLDRRRLVVLCRLFSSHVMKAQNPQKILAKLRPIALQLNKELRTSLNTTQEEVLLASILSGNNPENDYLKGAQSNINGPYFKNTSVVFEKISPQEILTPVWEDQKALPPRELLLYPQETPGSWRISLATHESP